jgi:hypothetical protein
MVLLSGENHINIKKNHLLKCLEQKKSSFKIFIEPLAEKNKINVHNDNNINLEYTNLTISDSDIDKMFSPNPNTNVK